ncbi:MAG: N-acetylmuramoyl-L-alanine amidase [Campylobacterales bacterium]|nr:N-acetylmuramoyl-L-alanine amidase [Campylobacterales bacterium]
MIGRIFFALLFLVSLVGGASDDLERLDAAKKSLSTGDELEQFRGYNECKSIHLQALKNHNSSLSHDALECIVHGGEVLKIDVAKYKGELAKLSPSFSLSPAAVPELQKPSEIVQNPLVFPKEYLRSSPVAINNEPTSNFLTPSSFDLMKPSAPLKLMNGMALLNRHRLVDAKWKDTGIELIFDSPIDPKEIHLSKIIEPDKQRFRYIIDIDSALLLQSKVLEHNSIQKIRLAQHDTKTLRLVIEHTDAIVIKPILKGQSVYIDLALQPASKVIPVQPNPIIQPPIVQSPPLVAALPPLIAMPPRDRSKKVIVIDPGHGGKDSGATGNGHLEKDIVLQIGLELAKQLRAQGYTVHMTRSNDTFIELKDRTKFANEKMADLFLSVHANAIPKGSDANAAYGIETYYLSPGRSERAMRVAALENQEDMGEMGAYGKLSFLNVLNSEKIIASNKLAIDIQKGVLGTLRKQFTNVKDNGVREAPFWVLVGAQMPAILLETGYISNPEESAHISDSKYQEWMVNGMLDGVKHYFANNP